MKKKEKNKNEKTAISWLIFENELLDNIGYESVIICD